MIFLEREQYNNVISVKLVIPGNCNANCVFCYMKDYKDKMQKNALSFVDNYLASLEYIINAIGDKNPISLDITGNEPTYDPELLIGILSSLKHFNIKDKVSRVTMTTNGFKLNDVIPYLEGVVDYVNISIHDFRKEERRKIMKWNTLSDVEYIDLCHRLKMIGIKASAISVIHKPIEEFALWRDDFISWCEKIGFIGLRLRCDVFWEENHLFDEYMSLSISDKNFSVITHENTTDSHWCRLRRYDSFRLFFLHGVLDTSIRTKGIEYVIADDGMLYCDYCKREKIEDYKYEIGKIYDSVESN